MIGPLLTAISRPYGGFVNRTENKREQKTKTMACKAMRHVFVAGGQYFPGMVLISRSITDTVISSQGLSWLFRTQKLASFSLAYFSFSSCFNVTSFRGVCVCVCVSED